MSDDLPTEYEPRIQNIVLEVHVLQVHNPEMGFDDILADIASELDVVIEFPGEG